MTKNIKGKKQFMDKLNKIEQIQREIQKEKKKVVVECSHQNEKGKLKIHPVNDSGEYECKYCKARFNMNKLSEKEINGAVKMLHDAIQQIRCYSDMNQDDKLIRLLGELDFNLQETSELYDRVVNVFGREQGQKKKKHREDDFGTYGSQSLSFIGGGSKRR
jgi:maltooligosyltrehalose synthase